MDKRYQVFVSSTYADLKDERQKVIQTLMECDCIPAGMELFPAMDEEQLTFIKTVIDDCDYYLLIIGGRYGSTDSTGISFTEREYEYAVEKGLKVVALIHGSPEEIPFGKSEQDPDLRARLQAFRDRACQSRLVKFWKTADELPGLVALNIQKTIRMSPAVGWVRANKLTNEETLGEINELRKRNASLEAELAKAAPRQLIPTESLADLSDVTTLKFCYFNGTAWQARSSQLSWKSIFGSIGPYLIEHPVAQNIKDVIEKLVEEHAGTKDIILDDQSFQTIQIQFQALGLITVERTTGTLRWLPTPAGEAMTFQLRAVQKAKTSGS